MEFIVANGQTFVSPQYSINKEWSCPDFVALRPPKKKWYVVEVSAAYNLNGLAEKVRNREKQWLDPLKKLFREQGICDDSWTHEILIFIRKERIKEFRSAIGHAPDVKVLELEQTLTPWAWPDDVRCPDYSFEPTP